MEEKFLVEEKFPAEEWFLHTHIAKRSRPGCMKKIKPSAFAVSFSAFLKRYGLLTLLSVAASNDSANNRKYINSAEMMTDNKMPAAPTNPVKQAVIIAVVMAKVNGVYGWVFLRTFTGCSDWFVGVRQGLTYRTHGSVDRFVGVDRAPKKDTCKFGGLVRRSR